MGAGLALGALVAASLFVVYANYRRTIELAERESDYNDSVTAVETER